MKRLSSLMALAAFLSFGTMSTLAFAGEDKKDEDKGGHIVVFSDEKKEEQKEKGGQVVFSDDKNDEKKETGGK